MDTLSEVDVPENGEIENPSATEPARDSVLAGANLLPDDSAAALDRLDRWEAARFQLEEVLSFVLGCDVSLTLLASGRMPSANLVDIVQTGGVAGVSPQYSSNALWFAPAVTGILLEGLLGGLPRNALAIVRELSELERQILENVVRTAGAIFFPDAARPATVDASFEPVSVRALTRKSEFAAGAFCAEFHMMCGDVSGGAVLVIASLNELMTALPVQNVPADSVRLKRERRLEKLTAMSFEFEAILEGNLISFSDLTSLQVGDVIALESGLDSVVAGTINSVGAFEGTIEPLGDGKSFRIDRMSLRDS